MIELTKINGESVVINSRLIEYIEEIPESKVIMTTGKYYIVVEPASEIIEKVISFEHRVTTGIGVSRAGIDSSWQGAEADQASR